MFGTNVLTCVLLSIKNLSNKSIKKTNYRLFNTLIKEFI
jgi:hypothetical protein